MMTCTPTLINEPERLDSVLSSHGPIETKEEGKASVIMVQRCAQESEDMVDEDDDLEHLMDIEEDQHNQKA